MLGVGSGCGEEDALVWVPAWLWGLGGPSGGAALGWELLLGWLGAGLAAAQTQLCPVRWLQCEAGSVRAERD